MNACVRRPSGSDTVILPQLLGDVVAGSRVTGDRQAVMVSQL